MTDVFVEPGPAAGLGPADLRLLIWQGRRELAQGALEHARDTLELAALLFPSSAEVQRALAELAERRGRPRWAEGARALAAALEARHHTEVRDAR